MRKFYIFIALSLSILLSFSTITAQTFDGEWTTAYVTDDDNTNGTNQRTMSVAAITGQNNFVALVSRSSNESYYLVGYRDADSSSGRFDGEYGGGIQSFWAVGFEPAIYFRKPMELASNGDQIFVANNDDEHNILVFDVLADEISPNSKRLATTNSDSLWAIDVNDSGHVFVTTQGNDSVSSKVLVYDSNDSEWSSGHSAEPRQTIILPDNGLAEGVTSNSDGTLLYVSNKDNGKIYAYTGNITDGYSLAPSFSYDRLDYVDSANVAGPLGLSFLDGNNILFVAVDSDPLEINSYWFGRMYALNPNTGEILDTIDVAEWNASHNNGAYDNHKGGIASGFTSTFSISIDENKNVYSQSYYGWTVEKWIYSGTLPTIDLTITSVEKTDNNLPTNFTVSQNYPNPFNPSTTIEFAVTERAPITLAIYSITGELITKLINGAEFNTGNYKVSFDASRLASGTYIYSINNGVSTISKKMTLLK